MTRVPQLAAGALLLAATGGVIGVAGMPGATAASCSAITISAARNLTLDVSSVTVVKGGCVRFANLTDVSVTVSVVGSSFSERLPARTPSSASRSFTANKSASVRATDGVRRGRGSIIVESAGATAGPAATPTPTRSVVVVPPVKPGKPTPAASASKHKALHDAEVPSGTSTDAAAAVNTQHTFAAPAVPVLPAQPAGGAASAPPHVDHPMVAPRVEQPGNDPRLTSTAVEPVSGSGRGLPATVAAVLVVGLAAAYARTVLVAGEAVERRRARPPVRRTV
ncbi:MAG TPA: hypothetical protein VHE57_00995 [Mycobacteriales bacterium]|nr:hypothetical protein [Mycobacteriales bacterium]